MSWRPIENLPLPWVDFVNQILSKRKPPDFDGDTLYMASDYAGEHKGSKYQVLSYLLFDLDHSSEWPRSRMNVREAYLPDNRKMQFKSLNDGHRRRALEPFLDAAMLLSGLCVSFVIDISLPPLLTDPRFIPPDTRLAEIAAKWKPKSMEKAVRIAHFGTLLFAGVTKPGQSLIWISDIDEIAASERHASDFGEFASAFTTHLVPFELGDLKFGTTVLDVGDRGEEDLNAVPDLVAGSLAQFCEQTPRELWWPGSSEQPFRLPDTAATAILHQLYSGSGRLVPVTFVVGLTEEGQIKTFDLNFGDAGLA